MSTTDYLLGETTRIHCSAADAAGVATDPPVLRLRVKSPSGSVTDYTHGADPEIVRAGVGLFHADIALDAVGYWSWRWETGLPHVGADEGLLLVRKGRFS